MQRPNQNRSNRARRLARKLAAYTVCGAASLSAREANAAIIYTDLGSGGLEVFRTTINLDLDLNGTDDLRFGIASFPWVELTCSDSYRSYCDFATIGRSGLAFVQGVNAPAKILTTVRNSQSAFALNASGRQVTRSATGASAAWLWTFRTRTVGPRTHTASGSFYNNRGFVGTVFPIDGKLHTAWVDVSGSASRITLYGFAYQTMPGKPIAAGAVPEPPSLVLLAAGATGLATLRRKRTATCARDGVARLETVQPRESDA